MKNNKIIGLKKIFILLILFILILNLVIILYAAEQSTSSNSNSKTLEEYLSENQGDKTSPGTSNFMELTGGKRNDVFQTASDPESRNAMIQQVSIKANEVMINRVEGANLISIVLETRLNDVYKKLQENKFDFLKITDMDKLKEAVQSVGVPWESAEKRLHSKLDKNLIDFEESKTKKLKWSDLKDKNGKPRNIIGDGDVWLDMDNLPLMTKGIQYKEGKFTLTLENGGKLVIGKGSTNEKGEINFIANLPDKGVRKFTGEDGKENYIPGLKQFISNDPNFVPSLKNFRSSSDKGEIEITSEGFSIKGDGAKIDYGEFSFGRKAGESSSESYVKFYEEGMILKGTEMKYGSEVKVGSTKSDFVFRPNGDLPASVVSFLDSDGKKIWGNFDSSGKLTHVAREGIQSGTKDDWVELKGKDGKIEAGFLKNIYDSSGSVVKSLISDSVGGKRVTFSQLTEKFYSDQSHKKEGERISIDSTQSDFLVINAKNYDVGGTGTIQPLHDLTSLRAYDTKDFYVLAGEKNKAGERYYIHLENNELKVSGNSNIKPEININNINLLGDNQVISEQKWKLSMEANSKGNFVSASNRVIEGITSGVVSEFTLPSGVKINKPVTVGITLDINEDDFNKNVKPGVEGVWFSSSERDAAIEGSLKSDTTLRADIIIPLKGVSVNGEQAAELVDKITPAVIKGFFPQEGIPIEGKNLEIKMEVVDSLKAALVKSSKSIDYIELDKISVELQNNPSTNIVSLVLVSGNKKGTAVPLDQIFGDSTQSLGRDLLEASLRLPDNTKGSIEQFSYGYLSSTYSRALSDPGKSQKYSGSQLRYMFESNLGTGRSGLTSKWNNMVYKGDDLFFNGYEPGYVKSYIYSPSNGFLKNYFNTVTKK
jgi:hypothetical protein